MRRDTAASAPDLLAAYDAQVRRRPIPDGPDDAVEEDGGVVRVISATGWSGVTYADLASRDVDGAIAAQIARIPGTWEWKHHAHDRPPELPERLLAAGFWREEPETLMVAGLDHATLDAPAPAGIAVRAVGADGVADLVAVHDAVFGGDHADLGAAVRAGVERGTVVPVVAYDGGGPAGALRGHGVRRPLGRLHAAVAPRPRDLPRAGRPARGARPRAWRPLSAGRRAGDQPPAVRPSRLHRPGDHHALPLAGLTAWAG